MCSLQFKPFSDDIGSLSDPPSRWWSPLIFEHFRKIDGFVAMAMVTGSFNNGIFEWCCGFGCSLMVTVVTGTCYNKIFEWRREFYSSKVMSMVTGTFYNENFWTISWILQSTANMNARETWVLDGIFSFLLGDSLVFFFFLLVDSLFPPG